MKKPKNVLIGVPITNDLYILQYIVDSQTKDFENGLKALSSDLRKELTEALGPHTRTFNKEGKRLLVWQLSHGKSFYQIFSGTPHGTSYEICHTDHESVRQGKYTKEITDFLQEMSQKLKRERI